MGWRRKLGQAGVAVTTNRVGSMWTWFFTGEAVGDFEQAAKSDTAGVWAVSPGDDGGRGVAAAFAV